MKVLIIGAGPGVAGAAARLRKIDPSINIIVAEEMPEIRVGDYDLVINELQVPTTPFIIRPLTVDLKSTFYPKRKHSPKGHERPYKYHP